MRSDGGRLPDWNGLLERQVRDELHAAHRVPRRQELRDDGQRVRYGNVDLRFDERKLPRRSNLRWREPRLAQRVRLHAERVVCGQELRPRAGRLREHGELRHVYTPRDLRRERMRLHAGVEGDGLQRKELRPGLRRL